MKKSLQNVYSPCDGFVKNVLVTPSAYVYEWETLFVIETNEKKKLKSL
ncbi:hypothetical protein BN982_03123 [Halobacillus karajensis]|uniref:Uncharacterized protein n=1 Tax=Halobacillus karajensis TaxID=195088 RepID=A0A024P5Z4_9BACI|nr:hypothetical protein BN982_03123 [Halobacillus karajensis]CDQ23762.1 hypothetical protein BN983_02013 [Halobacillus karajensis]CDQ27240.1 hypothetical protein BN981_01494 [Halobacillus karajensis]